MRRSRWMKLFSEYGFKAKYHLGKENVVVESWSRKKSEAKNEFWIDKSPLAVGFGCESFVEIKVDKTLVDRECQELKRSKIVLVQFSLESKRALSLLGKAKESNEV
ncbi:hypothetical protein Tco_1213383 [Tanacetum coccineum]